MTTKKTTKKKTTRKKSTARKSTRKKKTDDEPNTDTPTTVDASSTEATPKKTRKKSTRKKAAKKTTSKKTAAKKSTRKKTTRKSTRKKTDDEPTTTAEEEAGRVVEEGDGQIIIRFPPAAPSPFRTEQPAQPAPRTKSAPAATTTLEEEPAETPPVVDTADEGDEQDSDIRIVSTDEEEPSSSRFEPEKPARRDAEEDDSQEDGRISRSKKRRMRRRRRRSTSDDAPDDRGPQKQRQPEEPAREDLEDVDEDEDEDDERVATLDDIAETDDVDTAADTEDTDRTEETETTEDDEKPSGRRRRRRGRRGRRSSRRGEDRDEDEDRRPQTKVPPAETRKAPKAAPGTREMIINAIPREECRIAILHDNRLEEIYLERATSENHVGNIYKGIVTNVESSIQAAFIDFGQGKNGFLHISDLHPQYFPDGGGQTENVGHKMPRRSRPPIQRCLRRGQEMIVQVTKEGIGTKGPTLSTYLSIPGRFMVMMPGMSRLGVSRRIEDDESRDKLRHTLNQLELPGEMGFIARTAALDRTKKELQGDLTYLTRLWRAVENRRKGEPAPAELYRESDLVIRTIRDVFSSDIERIVIDDPEVAERAHDFLSIFSPRSADIITRYEDPEPIFHKYGIEAELERLHSRRVPLKSGGSLVIEPTEALVAIDVNSGRFRTEDDAETTAFKINLEAADEIARQLRLRDLGGVVVCDFIDMRMEKHRREIERRLSKHLKDHKERAKVLRTSQFGIIELTRQRQRASLTRSVYQDCRHCRGTGLAKTVESVALDVTRLLQLAVTRDHIQTIEVSVSPDVAYLLQNRKRQLLHDLEVNNRRTISIRPDPNFSLDQVEMRCTDARGRLVPHT